MFKPSANSWSTFRVSVEGNEVLNLTNPPSVLALLAGVKTPIYKDIDELFEVISGGGSLDRAIKILDKI
jgi:hypothetical protein